MSLNRNSPNFATIQESSRITVNTPLANGRIDIVTTPSSLNVPIYDQRNGSKGNNSFCKEAMFGQWSQTELSMLFFSEVNISALQQGIRGLVYNRSNKRFTIGVQSEQELKIIMKGIYFQYARHDPTSAVVDQVRILNQYVLDYAVNNILSNLEQYEKYRVDISTLPVPMERSSLVSNKGTKTLELKSFL